MIESSISDYTVYAIGAPIVLMMIAIEALISSKNNTYLYKRNDSLGTIGLIVGNVIVNILTIGSILGFYLFLYQFRLFEINAIAP